MKSRRSLKQLLINPETQIRYGLLFLSIAIVIHVVITILCVSLYAAWTANAVEVSGVPIGVLFALIVGAYIVMYVFAFILGLLISHRVYGPLVNIERFLSKVKQGDFSERITLRKADDKKLKQLAESLNDMAAILEKGGKFDL